MKKSLVLFINYTLLCSIPFTVHGFSIDGLSADKAGLAIAKEADLRDTGFGSFTAEMEMILRNRKGEESTRKIRNQTFEVIGDGDKSMSIFDEPTDIKGTVSLTHSHGLKPDDQWLYLPSVKRVKRINSKNKSGPFMGSEFAYEDIGSQEVEKYTYTFIREEKLNDRDCYVVERKPAYEYSGYTRQTIWVDKQTFYIHKVLFYDRKQTLLKTLEFKEYQQYKDKYWRAHIMDVVNHQTEKSTTLKWFNFNFDANLEERDFTQNALKNTR